MFVLYSLTEAEKLFSKPFLLWPVLFQFRKEVSLFSEAMTESVSYYFNVSIYISAALIANYLKLVKFKIFLFASKLFVCLKHDMLGTLDPPPPFTYTTSMVDMKLVLSSFD